MTMAKISVLVKVTARHIQKGQPNFADSCPVALAVRSLVRKNVHVSVADDGPEILLCSDGTICTHKLRLAEMNWIANFDDGEPVKPFQFKMRVRESMLSKKAL